MNISDSKVKKKENKTKTPQRKVENEKEFLQVLIVDEEGAPPKIKKIPVIPFSKQHSTWASLQNQFTVISDDEMKSRLAAAEPPGGESVKPIITISVPPGVESVKPIITISEPPGGESVKPIITISEPPGGESVKPIITISESPGGETVKPIINISEPPGGESVKPINIS